jgi:hypothetical protein
MNGTSPPNLPAPRVTHVIRGHQCCLIEQSVTAEPDYCMEIRCWISLLIPTASMSGSN